jgi:hypothetical protein
VSELPGLSFLGDFGVAPNPGVLQRHRPLFSSALHTSSAGEVEAEHADPVLEIVEGAIELLE